MQYQKVTFANITTGLIRKVFKYWEAVKLTLDTYKVYRILIFVWKLEIYNWQQKLVFSLNDKFILIILQKMSDKYPSMTGQFVSQLFFQVKNGVPWKSQLAQLTTQPHMLFIAKSSYLCVQRKLSVSTSHFIPQIVNKMNTQALRLNNSSNFYCFNKDILRSNWHVFFLQSI